MNTNKVLCEQQEDLKENENEKYTVIQNQRHSVDIIGADTGEIMLDNLTHNGT